jgi:hypothetical protein
MSYRLEQFGTTILPNYNPESDIGSGKAKIPYIDLPGGGAYDPLGSEPAPIGVANFVKRCTLAADTPSALQSAYDELMAWTGKRDKLYRRKYADGNMQWCYARLEEVRTTRKYGDLLKLDLELEFTKFSPVWNGLFYSEVFLKSEIAAGGGTVYINNNGNANQDDVVITVLGSGTDITDLYINKMSPGGGSIYDNLSWSGVLGAGQQLVIDCGAYTVEKQGVDDYNNFSLGPYHAEDIWFRLWGPTSNRIEIGITGGDNNVTVKFEYYDAYR